jgi:hypothetical protein
MAYETLVAQAAITGSGSITGTGDSTSLNSPLQASQPISTTLTVNADGTFSTPESPGWIMGVVVSDSQLIELDGFGTGSPTILLINITPTP